jgi:hypothetical protein
MFNIIYIYIYRFGWQIMYYGHALDHCGGAHALRYLASLVSA